MTHELKTLPGYRDSIRCGAKTFEVRKDDRGYNSGDELHLIRHNGTCSVAASDGKCILRARIGYILVGGQFGIEPGYVVMALKDVV